MTISEVKNILKTMRKHNRRVVVLPAELEVDGKQVNCTAYDVSLGGVRLKVDAPIDRDKQVIVRIKDKINQVADVVWSAEGFVGLNFKENPRTIKADLGVLAMHLN